ncbi:MAG: hypothetical protein M3Q62_01700 [Actinomycetota bacterium]|nr:hypothetical protein [Actinomycetota bacterium]MDQ3497896.1 hypothetical protein [Actinomycetota bacterium]
MSAMMAFVLSTSSPPTFRRSAPVANQKTSTSESSSPIAPKASSVSGRTGRELS